MVSSAFSFLVLSAIVIHHGKSSIQMLLYVVSDLSFIVSCQNWTVIPTTAAWSKGKEISCRVHDDIWLIREDGFVYHWNSSVPIWKSELPYAVSRVSATFEKNRAWVTNDFSTEQLMRFDGSAWNHVPSNDTYSQICAKDYNTAVGVTARGFAQRYDEGKGWSSIFSATSPTAKHCSIGKDGTIWCIDTNRAIWRLNNVDQRWIQMVGVADVVDVYDATRVLTTNSETHDIYVFMVGNTKWTNEMKKLEGGCIQATISGSHLYCVAPGNGLFWAPYPLDTY